MKKIFLLFVLVFILSSCFWSDDKTKWETIIWKELSNWIDSQNIQKMDLIKQDFEKDYNSFTKDIK